MLGFLDSKQHTDNYQVTLLEFSDELLSSQKSTDIVSYRFT